MEEMKDQVVIYLSKRKFLTLATSTLNGKPNTHPLAYVNIGATTYFSTSKESRKIKNIKENPNVSFSIYDSTEHLDEVRSVQIEGEATVVTNEKESEEILELLHNKFPFMKEMQLQVDSVIVKITPKTCFFIDYTKGFGNRDKIKY